MDENQSEQNETLTDDQHFEDLQEHHVTPPGDPEFPELEFLFEKESSSLVSPLDVKSPFTPELESEKTSTPLTQHRSLQNGIGAHLPSLSFLE